MPGKDTLRRVRSEPAIEEMVVHEVEQKLERTRLASALLPRAEPLRIAR